MLRLALIAAMLISAAGGAGAQEPDADPVALAGPEVDFILRPSQEPESGSDEFWRLQLEPEAPPPIDAPIGPPPAGPTGEEAIGPPLLGPIEPPPEEPLPARRRAEPEADPFQATGVRLGAFVIRPSIEIGVSATDNVNGGVDKEAAAGLVIEPEVNIHSEDERYELDAILRGEAILYEDDQYDDREAEARLRARYDLTSRTSVDLAAAYVSALESFTDPDTPEAAAERPGVESLDAALGLTQRFGPLELGAHGFVAREVHEDVTLAGGGTARRDELDYTEFGTRLRAGYRVSGALTPFADVALARRDFDVEVDSSGLERSSLWGELRGGLVFDFGPKLTGEAALGYRHEDIEDEALEDIDAFVADAALIWSPRRLTEVRLDLSTDTQPTSVPGASASILYSGNLTVARRFTPRWTLEAGLGLDHERFVGADLQETTFAAFTGASYAFNRFVSVKGSYSYERSERDGLGDDTDAHVVGARVRLQR